MTHTIQEEEEEEEEYLASKHRIWQEKMREQKELLKALCNMSTANRIVAAAAAARAGVTEVLTSNASSPFRQCDMRQAIGGQIDGVLANELISASSWERAQRQRQKEQIAKVAMSLDTLLMRGLEHKQDLQTAMHNRSYNGAPLTTTALCPLLHADSSADKEVELDIDLCRHNLQQLSSPSAWQRRWQCRPASPQPIVLPRRQGNNEEAASSLPITSTCGTFDLHSPDSSSMNATSMPTYGLRMMGGNRLQRSFASNRPDPARAQRAIRRPKS